MLFTFRILLSFTIEMLELMCNRPTSRGYTGSFSIAVIAHPGRKWMGLVADCLTYLRKLSLGSKWVLDMQPFIWYQTWQCSFGLSLICLVLLLLSCVFCFLIEFCFCSSVLSHSHPLLPLLNCPSPWPFLCLDSPILVSV